MKKILCLLTALLGTSACFAGISVQFNVGPAYEYEPVFVDPFFPPPFPAELVIINGRPYYMYYTNGHPYYYHAKPHKHRKHQKRVRKYYYEYYED